MYIVMIIVGFEG